MLCKRFIPVASRHVPKCLLGSVQQQHRSKCTLPDLPYDYNALEPFISAEIMQLHHSKHHQTYVNNYNLAEQQLAEAVANGDQNKIIRFGIIQSFCGISQKSLHQDELLLSELK